MRDRRLRFGEARVPFEKTALTAAIAVATQVMVSAPALAEETATTIEEVIVTARKRSDNLQDVPLSVQAFTEDRIEELGIRRFEDFAVLSPSIAFISHLPGSQMMFVRGIADGSNPNRTTAATATMYLDEHPLTYSGGVADLHNYDIERIEVLNGPQGTYYGASATSGTVRIITNKPDPEAFSAGADLTAGTITDGEGVRTLEGFVNVPLGDRTAVRLVGWYDAADGFIDNVPTTRTFRNGTTVSNDRWAEDDYNEEETLGFRATLRSDLGERWRGTVAAIHQKTEFEGAWDHEPGRVGNLEVARFGPEYGEQQYDQVGWTLEGNLGIGDIVYAGAYFERDREVILDYSDYVGYASFGGWIQQFACDDYYWYGNVGCNDPTMHYDLHLDASRWSHEVRLSSAGEGPLHWIAGAYYEKNETDDNHAYWWMPGVRHDGGPGEYYTLVNGGSPFPDEWWSVEWASEWEQQAVFGELTYDFSDRLSATVGARAFDSKFDSYTAWAGYFFNARVPGGQDGSTSDAIYKFSLTYRAHEDLLTYFTYAEGFRPGGGNAEGQNNPSVPEIYDPDVLQSYEVGWKATLGDGRATFNGAVYYMDWQDFQTSIYDLLISQLGFRHNAGNAQVTGVETELHWALTPNLSVQAAATFNDAALGQDFNSTVDPSVVWAEEGRELPYVPRWKYAVNGRYEWEQGGSVTGYAQLTYSFTDESWNLLITEPFQAEAIPRRQAAYDLLDLRVGWTFGGGRHGIELFGTNLLDEQAEIFINTGLYDERVTTNRPRTLGIRLQTRFN